MNRHVRHVRRGSTLGFVTAAALLATQRLAAQEPSPAAGHWEVAGLPALNYDSDEGFGYGALAELYRHAPGAAPYRYTIQPTVQLSTRGRRDFTVFFDAPHLLPGGWRLDAFAGSEKQLATPYYGVGNDAPYDATLDADGSPNPYYYRFGRTRRQLLANVQHRLGRSPVRALVGSGAAHVAIDPTPFDSGTTLLAQHLGGTPAPGGWSNYLRAGLVWDTRDREVGPTRGVWSELLVQRFERALGSDFAYTRWTLTDRRYVPLGTERLVFANRLLLQNVKGGAPIYDLSVVQTSFKQQEGLGGAKTLRGIPKDRYVGKGMFLWNAELRWRAAELAALGKPLHLVLSGFVDSGRVWENGVVLHAPVPGLHHGVGGGARLGVGESFVVAVDAGHGEGSTPLYIGLGYLY